MQIKLYANDLRRLQQINIELDPAMSEDEAETLYAQLVVKASLAKAGKVEEGGDASTEA